MGKSLGYWKCKMYEAERAYMTCQESNKQDYKNAVRYAQRKIEQIESRVFKERSV